jgi:hypothetical protein
MIDSSITLGDIIGYVLTFIFGLAAGFGADRIIIKYSSRSTKNNSEVTESKNISKVKQVATGNNNNQTIGNG